MAESRFSIAIFFKLLCCILPLILVPKVVSVYAPICMQYKDIGLCRDGDEDPFFPLCTTRCKQNERVDLAICYIPKELEELQKMVGNYANLVEVTNDSSAAGIITDDVQSSILKCLCCIIQ